MSERQSKWDARYAMSGDTVPAPPEVLSRHADCLPVGGVALDLACGRGGAGEWLGARGFQVHAIDSSAPVIAAIRQRPGSRIRRASVLDVLTTPLDAERYDVIVVARFLERSVCGGIAAALKPGGTLFYQTFTAGLSNPDFMLAPNELLGLFPTLRVLRYRDDEPNAAGRAEAMLVGRDPRAPIVADR